MSILYFLGCFLISFGPALALLYQISSEPLLILLSLLAATAWVFVLILTSVVHLFLPVDLIFLLISSILQELCRIGIRIGSVRVVQVNRLKQALAIGLGY